MARLYEVPREGKYLLGHHDNERCVAMVADRCGLDYVLSTYPRLTQTIVVDMDAFNRSLEDLQWSWRTLGG